MTTQRVGRARSLFAGTVVSLRIACRSLTALASWSTALVICLATPLLSVIFLTLMTSSVGGHAESAVAFRFALVATTTTAAALTIDLGMTDRRYGTIDALLTNGGLRSLGLWLGRLIVTAAIAFAVGFTSSLAIAVTYGSAPDPGWHLVFLVAVSISGSAMGTLILAVGLPLRDPNVIATSFMLLMPLLSTALLPASDYPRWLRPVTRIVPGAHVIDGTRDLTFSAKLTALLLESFLALLVFVGALVVLRVCEVRARRYGTAIMTS